MYSGHAIASLPGCYRLITACPGCPLESCSGSGFVHRLCTGLGVLGAATGAVVVVGLLGSGRCGIRKSRAWLRMLGTVLWD